MFFSPFMIPIVAILTFGFVAICRSPIGLAIAARISGRTSDPMPEVLDLRDQVDQLRLEMSEMHERVDFTERLLARVNETGQVQAAGRS